MLTMERGPRRHSLSLPREEEKIEYTHPSLGTRLLVLGQAGHAGPLGGWHCCSKEWHPCWPPRWSPIERGSRITPPMIQGGSGYASTMQGVHLI